MDGGYAGYAVAPADCVLRLPDGYSDEELAPLLCVGIIGYRALNRAELPPHGRLGIYGFGASAHLAAQGATVHVMTRSAAARISTTPYSLDKADQAFADLAEDRVNGAAVLRA